MTWSFGKCWCKSGPCVDVLRQALEWCERDPEYAPLQPLLTVLLETGRSLDATDERAELFERGLMERLTEVSAQSGMLLDEILHFASSLFPLLTYKRYLSALRKA